MKTSHFDYILPRELIAQEPLAERAMSRMMVVHRDSGELEHRTVKDLPEYLRNGDLVVVNNTKVFPARILGKRAETGGQVELLLVEKTGGESNQWAVDSGGTPVGAEEGKNGAGKYESVWDCFLKAGRRPQSGVILDMANGRIKAEVLEIREEGRVMVRLFSEAPLFNVLDEEGFAPVPPYIRRDGEHTEETRQDMERYQTVYAKTIGAVAAPTAGLHFTSPLFEELENKGVGKAEITLHVGPGTFKPVSVETVEDHNMESERYEVSDQTARMISEACSAGGRIVAVGSTTVRTLETVMMEYGLMKACSGRSKLFIYPPYDFKLVDMMLTNFHLPMSSLLMMVSALAGKDLIFRAYAEAVRQEYRFYSYGDCMLIA